MQYYDYHPETGEYLGTYNAHLDPMATEREGKDIYALPASATWDKPPTAPDKHVAVYKDGKWTIAEDNRSTEYWLDGQRHTMADLGPLPAGASLTPPEPERPTLEQVKAAKTAELWAAGDAMVRGMRQQFLSDTDLALADTHKRGIEDILAGKTNTLEAVAIQTKATMGGRSVEDLIKAYKTHETMGMIFAAIVGGEQDKRTAEIKGVATVEAVTAIEWTLTLDVAMQKTQEVIASLQP